MYKEIKQKMGQKYSSLKKYFFSKPEKNILLYGLDGAGKTAVFDKMQLDEKTYPMPMPDFCEGMVDLKKFKIYILDIARHITSRNSGHFFINNCDAVILVVDSTDFSRIDEINEIINNFLLSEELKNALIIVFANKQDLPTALNPTQVSEKLKLHEISRISHIQGTSGYTGDGVLEGLEYLNTYFSKNKWFNIF